MVLSLDFKLSVALSVKRPAAAVPSKPKRRSTYPFTGRNTVLPKLEKHPQLGNRHDNIVIGKKFTMDYCHTFKSNKPCSRLTREVKKLALLAAIECQEKPPNHRHLEEKAERIAALPIAQIPALQRKIWRKEYIQSRRPFFSGTNERRVPQVDPREHKVLSAKRDLQVYDSTAGLHMQGVFTLIPREEILENFSEDLTGQIYDSMAFVEVRNEDSTERGEGRFVVHENDHGTRYVTMGVHPRRAGQGLEQNLKHLDEDAQAHKTVGDWIRRMERQSTEYIGTESLAALGAIRDNTSYPGFDLGANGQESTIWPSIAVGRNVFLSAHHDLDFFLSATTVVQKTSTPPEMNAPICNYFCFPTKGVAVALRSGDILLFNPLLYHCISARCNKDIDEFCISLYLKTAVVGGWNNGEETTVKYVLERKRKRKEKEDGGSGGKRRKLDSVGWLLSVDSSKAVF